ncbi:MULTISPECIES: coiled-coil domain-containing protein 180 [unclassified Wolbachia]|uniref:coiled-coil domain-containing protein 180 n=1 Tax=unclassified Wolbachia TaxID=2640676 RepID=UPI00222E9E95|nr:coiled-coil domain-containing protein 180 [Wolbachia endosymbiont (group A) of Apoderus coryli]
MSIYIRFENDKQVETTILESKPKGKNWYEAPKDFDWQKSYCLTEGGEIAQRTKEDIQKELLDNAKLCTFDSMRFYYDSHINQYAGHSHQKSKSYAIQAKAAENILAVPESMNEKDKEIIEPLAKVRGITIIEMARIIEEKVKKAVKAIVKCEELEDMAKRKIEEAKSEEELQTLLDDCKQKMQNLET